MGVERVGVNDVNDTVFWSLGTEGKPPARWYKYHPSKEITSAPQSVFHTHNFYATGYIQHLW